MKKLMDGSSPNGHTVVPRSVRIQILLKMKVKGHDVGCERSAISAIAELLVLSIFEAGFLICNLL